MPRTENPTVASIVSRLPTPAPAPRDPGAGPVPPAGFRLWEPGQRPPRPTAAPEMFHGPIGRFAQAAAAYTEADPVAMFAQALTAYGIAANHSAYMEAGNDRHAAALFCLIVGRTAKGKKGTSWAVVRELLYRIDPAVLSRVLGGFGSGEAVVDRLAEAGDNRLVVFEAEFGSLLARGRREGSTCSAVMRDLWDQRPLESRTRSGGDVIATGYHAGAIGHITREELRAKLTDSDLFGGFVNRWLIWWVERGGLQPDGGNVPNGLLTDTANELKANLTQARKGGVMARTPGAQDLWVDLYHRLDQDDPPGFLGLALNRSAPQCLRLSVALALADGSRLITEDHIRAAEAAWNYCRASAAAVFGETAPTPDAERLLTALREAGPTGLDLTEQLAMFARRGTRAEKARALLTEAGLAFTHTATPDGRGRPRTTTYAITPT